MEGGSIPLRIGLVGPAPDQPCGIGDYVRRLEPAMARHCRLIPLTYREALDKAEASECDGLLVHYERSLVPGPDYLRELSVRHPGKVLVAPHEVYAEDPFAFPYGSLKSSFPPLLWLKRLRYRWLHRDYARERALQSAAYHAHRVVPLSREGGEILRGLSEKPGLAGRILPPVPIARIDPPASRASGAAPGPASPKARPEGRPKAAAGIFGFLNPGLDYGAAFDLVAALGGDLALVLLGGDRRGYPLRESLEAEVRARGLDRLVSVTGYLPEESLAGRMAACDFFLAPMRFKSSSASVLQLFGLRKPILVPALPLTRYLRDEGAPLTLYSGPEDLAAKVRSILDGDGRPPEDRYPWDIGAVAEAYVRMVGEARAGKTPLAPQ